ncbi:MAG TPA: twin-arginine translocase TatA/TatE family subunit [Nitriliruptorales bacterium]|nr:twin-arginine translocase TatA/TatE family subunit [Nitriliruptorales bacterium]
MAGFGWQELMIILLIVLVIFGGAKLPGLARSMGESIKEFRRATDDEDEDGNGSSERRPTDASTS